MQDTIIICYIIYLITSKMESRIQLIEKVIKEK